MEFTHLKRYAKLSICLELDCRMLAVYDNPTTFCREEQTYYGAMQLHKFWASVLHFLSQWGCWVKKLLVIFVYLKEGGK